jgi:hypothetical protein
MDFEHLSKANKELAEKIESLSVKVTRQDKMISLCLELIKQFGHFVPNVVKEFNYELDKIRDGLGQDDLSETKIETYINGDTDHPSNLE